MCGFIGILRNQQQDEKLFEQRNNAIQHRGPDDEGYYHDEHISLGFRRLSIIDVESGHQPFHFEDERYWMVFNGEIYNYVELREELKEKGYSFRTESDTEVIAVLFQDQGVEAFSMLRGMFAIVIWDKHDQKVYGARDPFGIKPLFYKQTEEETMFGSEKKSLTLYDEQQQVNREALQHYLSYQYVPEPMTMNDGIHKVEPGHYFTGESGKELTFTRYFKANFHPIKAEEKTLIRDLQEVLLDSVGVHMRSDVPVGSFLSGGIDSSIIVSLAKEYNPNLHTFSVGFEHEGYSEVDVARETADKLNLKNTAYIITPEEYVKKLPKIMWHMDDPLADPACVPLYFVSREARKHVTVVLSGEGADELFGGYNIYREPESLKMFDSMPNGLKKSLNKMATLIPEGVKGKSFIERGTTPLRERYIGNAKMFEESEKQSFMKHTSSLTRYQDLTTNLFDDVSHLHPVNQMQYVDIHTWLRGDILLKADKMTMANSLELRVPFLDKEVFKLASKIGHEAKIADGTTKAILRKAARGIVPDHVLDRKKLGFPVPIRHWLRHELYDWAKQLIQTSQTDDYLHKPAILQMLEDHVQQKGDYSRKLWTVLMFMLWHQVHVERLYDIEELKREDYSGSKILQYS
ncbi:asparagine synthase [Pontibacillus halophilus JSM 076056 = DSM 19796]|uniref:asparagine synthase (glutamine-hydrolyzing) n=1 Tax=Pontibacillus halophilus JSM 076056 = DSM 19796 TaxID=1385510 RepID=A0A0A5I867_9BACI|nr:asparagine synthase (glutamine-hydrolyzing) [Pontibacillus halophilus]KGX92002.1 asparagine synthase [Pontibacillus halophilus JSM 076056 = DSM 19796]